MTDQTKKIEIPRWLLGHVDESGLSRVRDAIARAESRTRGEIVPMIVRGSSPVGFAGPFTFAIAMIFVLALAPVAADAIARTGAFPLQSRWTIELVAAAFAICVSPFAYHSRAWLRALIGRHDLALNAQRRAQLEFYQSRINGTEAHAGVLLFVSLLERRAVVLADAAIADRLPSDIWGEVVRLLTAGIREKDFAAGFERAIGKAGEILAEHFPAAAHGANELENELIIRE